MSKKFSRQTYRSSLGRGSIVALCVFHQSINVGCWVFDGVTEELEDDYIQCCSFSPTCSWNCAFATFWHNWLFSIDFIFPLAYKIWISETVRLILGTIGAFGVPRLATYISDHEMEANFLWVSVTYFQFLIVFVNILYRYVWFTHEHVCAWRKKNQNE